MSKSKSIKSDGEVLVTHAQLRVLVDHIASMITALDARVTECEWTRPVDPAVKEAGDALMADVRRSTAHLERALMLVPDNEPEGVVVGAEGDPSKAPDASEDAASTQTADDPPALPLRQ